MRRAPRLDLAPPELNLVPLLDMISLLIQVMLFNVQFGVFGALTSEIAPAEGGAPDTASDATVVRIDVDGFTVARKGAPTERVRCEPAPCDGPLAWDVAALRTLVAELRAPGSSEPVEAIVRPGTGVPFEVVVRTLDGLAMPGSDGAPLAVVSLVGDAP